MPILPFKEQGGKFLKGSTSRSWEGNFHTPFERRESGAPLLVASVAWGLTGAYLCLRLCLSRASSFWLSIWRMSSTYDSPFAI
jgi:hypothetical protein